VLFRIKSKYRAAKPDIILPACFMQSFILGIEHRVYVVDGIQVKAMETTGFKVTV
jgi:hypothetical protein